METRGVPVAGTGPTELRGGLSPYQRALVFLLVFTVPLRNLSLLQLPGANLRIGDAILLAGVVAAHLSWLRRPAPRRFRTLDWALMAFVLSCLASVLWSLDPEFGLARTFKYVRDLALYFVLLCCLERDVRATFLLTVVGAVGSFAYIVPVIVRSLTRAGALNLDAIATLALVSSGDLTQLRSEAIGAGTFAGTINDLGRWANIALLLLMGTGFWTTRTRIMRWSCWVAAAVLLLIQVLSLSRGTWTALLVAAVWWWARLHGRLRLTATVRVGLLLTVVAGIWWVGSHEFGQALVARLRSSAGAGADAAVAERFMLWHMALAAFVSHPLGGVGMGGGTVIAAANGVKDWYVHNVYLQMLFEMGLLGALVWGVVVLDWIWISLRVRIGALCWRDQVAAVAIQAAVLSLLVHGLTGTDFTEQEYWIVLALSASLARMSRSSPGSDAASRTVYVEGYAR